MPRTSSEEVAGILLDDPEGGTNQGFREAKEARWRGAAKLGRETSSPANDESGKATSSFVMQRRASCAACKAHDSGPPDSYASMQNRSTRFALDQKLQDLFESGPFARRRSPCAECRRSRRRFGCSWLAHVLRTCAPNDSPVACDKP